MAAPAIHSQPQPPQTPAAAEHDNVVLLRGLAWADLQRLLEARGERSVPRFAYAEGTLEIMSPSRPHESIKSVIGALVEAWCVEHGLDVTACGSWTLADASVQRAIEPDESYVIGEVPSPVRPDLAIEVVWSSGGLEKLDLYRRLAVREVWFWKGEQVRAFALRGNRYAEVESSEVLPGLDLRQLARFVQVTPMTRAIREYRAALTEGQESSSD